MMQWFHLLLKQLTFSRLIVLLNTRTCECQENLHMWLLGGAAGLLSLSDSPLLTFCQLCW